MPALVRTLGLLSALALMWLISIGLLLYGGSWLIYLLSTGYNAFLDWLWSYEVVREGLWFDAPRTQPNLPDHVWALEWSLRVMLVMTLVPFILNALQPLTRLAAQVCNMPRRHFSPVRETDELGALFLDVSRKARPGKRVRLCVIPVKGAMAFAMAAPFRGLVVISETMARSLPREELRWVLAHELAHIRYRDMLVGSIWVASMNGIAFFDRLKVTIIRIVLRLFAEIRLAGLALVVSWFLSVVVWTLRCGQRVAIWWFLLIDRFASRQIEFRADRFAAHIEGVGAGISVLSRLQGDAEPLFNGLFATHPRISQRIARLQGLGGITVESC